jgi:hypothetical protein
VFSWGLPLPLAFFSGCRDVGGLRETDARFLLSRTTGNTRAVAVFTRLSEKVGAKRQAEVVSVIFRTVRILG